MRSGGRRAARMCGGVRCGEAADWEEAVEQQDQELLRQGGDGETPASARRFYGALRVEPR